MSTSISFPRAQSGVGINAFLRTAFRAATRGAEPERRAVDDAAIDGVVTASRLAQQRFLAWPEDAVDALIEEAAAAVNERAAQLAEACVEETGIGSVTDKVTKIGFASLGVAA